MRKTPLRRIGKVGEANIEARKRIAAIAEEKGLNYCEIGLEGCLHYMILAPAHRHPRTFYKGDVELLSDYDQWISACVVCHGEIDRNKELLESTFNRLRPPTSPI